MSISSQCHFVCQQSQSNLRVVRSLGITALMLYYLRSSVKNQITNLAE